MNQHRFATSGAEEARRAMLRDRVLNCGRRLGLSTHAVISLTEQLTHRPWKRCTAPDLVAVLAEYRRLGGTDARELPDGAFVGQVGKVATSEESPCG